MRRILSSLVASGSHNDSGGGRVGAGGHEGEDEGGGQGDGGTASSRELATDGGTVVSEETVPGEAVGDSGLLDSDLVRSAPFWLPTTLLVVLFVYGAIGWNVLISLTEWEGLGSPEYASLDLSMYGQMLGDPIFWTALRNTFVLLVAFTVVTLAVGLLVAILLDRGIRFSSTFRTIYLLPFSLSFVVTALFWSWMYNPEIGMINVILRSIGLGTFTQAWLSDPQWKMAAVIFALMWQFSGYAMVIYLAGLRAIPDDQYEAARIDGASSLRMYWKVIIPQLRASTMSAAVVLMVFALKAFDFLFVMFGTQPGPSVDILAMMMYREAFSVTNWAYASAIATVLFLLAILVIGPYLGVQYRRGDL